MSLAHAVQAMPEIVNKKHFFSQHNIQVPATIRLKDGRFFAGKTHDINHRGAVFDSECSETLEQETPCILTLFLGDEPARDELKIKCILSPLGKGHAALSFQAIAAPDYIKFIFLLARNFPEPEQLFNEIKEDPGVRLLGDI